MKLAALLAVTGLMTGGAGGIAYAYAEAWRTTCILQGRHTVTHTVAIQLNMLRVCLTAR